ncbi:MAG: helix-turn-helix domain-containing protein [Phenylobacterium sp.]|jgi:transcriptional regulator with XRE-family HTH domain|nr:helix-turn-helix domain-containing protein [Phenylobacterium sp.]
MAGSPITEQYRALREALAHARRSRGVTQTDLSRRLAKPQSYVSKLERGERRIDLIEVFEIAEALEVDPLALIASVHAQWVTLR